jgi:hypothetical protein
LIRPWITKSKRASGASLKRDALELAFSYQNASLSAIVQGNRRISAPVVRPCRGNAKQAVVILHQCVLQSAGQYSDLFDVELGTEEFRQAGGIELIPRSQRQQA